MAFNWEEGDIVSGGATVSTPQEQPSGFNWDSGQEITTPSKVTKSGIDQSYQATNYGSLGAAGKFVQPRTQAEATALDVKSQQKYKPSFPFESEKDITTSSSLITNPLPAVGKTIGNIPSSTLQMGKDLVSLVTSPIQTLKGIKGLVTGAVQKVIPGYQADEKYVDSLVENYKERYGSYDNLKRTIVNDPMGFGSELFALLQGGATAIGKGKQFNTLVSKTAQPIIKPTSQLYNKAKTMATNINNKLYGGVSGIGSSSADLAYKGNKEFLSAARGKVTPEEITNIIQDTSDKLINKLDDLKNNKSSEYGKAQSALEDLAVPINTRELGTEVSTWLYNNKVRLGENGLDFSKSKFVYDPKAQEAINIIYQEMMAKPNISTAGELNTFIQKLSPLYKEGNSARSLISRTQDATRQLLNNVDEYTKLTSKYKKTLSDMSLLEDDISSINKLLSKGDTDAAVKKLTKIVKSNNDGKKAVLDLMKQETGKDITPTILGYNASPWMSRFGKKALEFGAIGSMFGKFNSKALLLLAATSPRITTEFLNALGVINRTGAKVGSTIGNMKIPAATTGVVSGVKNIPYLPKSK